MLQWSYHIPEFGPMTKSKDIYFEKNIVENNLWIKFFNK